MQIDSIDKFKECSFISTVSRSNWKLAVLVFPVWRRKTEELEEKASEQEQEEPTTNSTHT